jgi:hypothetical protein
MKFPKQNENKKNIMKYLDNKRHLNFEFWGLVPDLVQNLGQPKNLTRNRVLGK